MQHHDSESLNTFNKIEKAIIFIEENKTENLDLRDIAQHVNLSEYHFHRLFTQWVGTTPDRFFRYIKKEYIINELNKFSLLDLTFQAGLSNPSRLFDLFITYEALTPAQYKQKGKNVIIYYGFHETPFGTCFLALTEKGILDLRFTKKKENGDLQALEQEFPLARFEKRDDLIEKSVNLIFNPLQRDKKKAFHLLIRSTNFQIKVWEALLKLPFGCLTTYSKIANYIGRPSASRAVGQALAKNPIAYLIPCHRVIEKIGNTGNYRWGIYRKKAMIGWEMALTSKNSKSTC